MGPDGKSPIHNQIGAGDEGGAISGEEQGGFGNVSRNTSTTQGVERGGLIGKGDGVWGLAEVLLPEASIDVAGADGVHANAARRQLKGEIPAQGDESGFGGQDDTAGLTTATPTSTRSSRTTSQRGMSETGGGNASLGRRSGGRGIRANSSSRGRAQGIPSTT